MTPIEALKGSHAGRPALILGGGLSLPREFDLADRRYPGALLISANQHGALLERTEWRGKDLMARRRELGDETCRLATADFIVHLDSPNDPHQCPDVLGFDVKRISCVPHPCHIVMEEFPRGTGSSGMVAAWCASVFGCAPVILCGMSCYGDGSWWHSPKAPSSGLSSPPQYHASIWRDMLPQFMDATTVRAAGGPLVDIFGAM